MGDTAGVNRFRPGVEGARSGAYVHRGEPLLEWPKLLRAVHYAENRSTPGKQVNFAVTTNGLLITEHIAAFLDKHKFQVHLSFDGVPKAQNYRHKESFAAMDQLLDRLRNEHTDMFEDRLQICITVVPPTVPYLSGSIRYLIDKGVRYIAVSPSFTPCISRTHDHSTTLDGQFLEIRDISLAHFTRTGRVPFLLFKKVKNERQPGRNSHAMCGVMSGEGLVIDMEGQAHGCPLLADCYQKFPSDFLRQRMDTLRMGDFRDSGFRKRRLLFPEAIRKTEIFHNKEKKYSSFRKCGTCEHIDNCSVCPVSIGYDPENEDPHRIPDFLCAFNMAALKYRDLFPAMPNPIEKLNSLLAAASMPSRRDTEFYREDADTHNLAKNSNKFC